MEAEKGKIMTENNHLKWHIRRTLVLGLPIVAAQVLQMLIGVTDSLMVARLGELPLAQITLGTQVMFFAIIFTVGFSIPVGPIVGTSLAQGDETQTRRAVRMSLWQAVILSFIFVPFGFYAREILGWLGQDAEVVEGAGSYIDIAVWTLPVIFIGNVLKGYLIALERNSAVMLISVIGVLVNIVGNYALIFGHFGMPRLGLVGSAWATLITNTAMLIAVIVWVLREDMTKRVELFRKIWRPDWEMFWQLVRLGVPTTFGLLSEVGLFQFATLMMGWIGVAELAAFGLVLQIASLTFMIPLGFSIVASVRAGQAMGHKNRHELLMVARAAILVITATMIVTACLFLFAPEWLVGLILDTSRPDSASLMALAVSYLAFAAAFQISDGAQVAAISILRGMLDMFWPAILAFISYWCIGMPVGYWLAFSQGWEGAGVWMGLVTGLTAASILLWARFFYLVKPERLKKLFA